MEEVIIRTTTGEGGCGTVKKCFLKENQQQKMCNKDNKQDEVKETC